MTKIKSIGTPTWIAPYFEFEHPEYSNDGIISSLRPLRYEDGSYIKVKVFHNNNCGDPFVEFCKHSEIAEFLEQAGSLLNFNTPDGLENSGIAIKIGTFIANFSDKSPCIHEADFFTKSTLKAINQKARYWRNNGADYILIY